ncbi:hypothetical protein [Arenimonas composti]|uniref:Exo-alpha-sialidase n=2 Tax=Arenimonas TaxID=490567 RepID=A0A091BYU6_9GAMM|nr:hypothetical protein [Arenimonas composti]KFN49530.1 hypothetical protein P873_10275 [Arenimonas composti TR7-09 = DSM 18010]
MTWQAPATRSPRTRSLLLICYPLLFLLNSPEAAAAEPAPWPLPAPATASAPNLTLTSDNGLLLSWLEPFGNGHRLRYAIHRGDDAGAGWSDVATAAAGEDWFVNWADVPSMLATDDGALWAHVLVRNGSATYAYDTRLFRSDDGVAWQALGPVHDDGTATEHGFATLWPRPGGGLGIAWLDGRETRAGSGHDGADAHAGHGEGGGLERAMTLRAASYRGAAKLGDVRLDAATCDCCQTDSAVDGDTVWLAWRDRAEGEVRDILVIRNDDGRWDAPVVVHADGWVTPGCPVNGPAVTARDGTAWVGWYTEAGGEPELRVARSADGETFAPPRTVTAGAHVLGRVDIAADADGVWFAWLEEEAGAQSLWLARFDPALGSETLRVKVADIAGRGRATGVPRLQVRDGAAWLAWTEVVDGKPRLRGARVRP